MTSYQMATNGFYKVPYRLAQDRYGFPQSGNACSAELRADLRPLAVLHVELYGLRFIAVWFTPSRSAVRPRHRPPLLRIVVILCNWARFRIKICCIWLKVESCFTLFWLPNSYQAGIAVVLHMDRLLVGSSFRTELHIDGVPLWRSPC